jgi:hypothetical protein
VKSRRWGVIAFRQHHGAPMVSLGVHADRHTPRVDLYLVVWTVCIGRIVPTYEPSRLIRYSGSQWSGHTDDCWHREALAEAERGAGDAE